MEAKELLQAAKTMTFDRFERELNRLVRENYKYNHLSSDNRDLVLDFIKKHLGPIHRGEGISSVAIANESYKLYQHRQQMKLTENDLADIKEIWNLFKK